MNATTVDSVDRTTGQRNAGRLLGLRNLVRKDMLDWRHGNRTWIVAAATTAVVLWIAAFVIPRAVTAGLVTILYGAPDVPVVIALALATVTVPAIFVGITLVASTFVSNQAAVGAIGLLLFILPSIVGGIAPA